MNKSEKKKAAAYRNRVKAVQERMGNLSPSEIAQIENYTVYQIMYINDAACNECKFLGMQLEKVKHRYKSNQVQKIYSALMKRVNAYWDMVQSTGIDMNSVANLFSEMDEYMDESIYAVRDSIEEVLHENGVVDAEWVAAVETTYTVCSFAEQVSLGLINKASVYSKNASALKRIVISAIVDVARSLTSVVQQIHIKSEQNIDLNKCPKSKRAAKALQETFLNPTNFINAATVADKENAKEGHMQLIYTNDIVNKNK